MSDQCGGLEYVRGGMIREATIDDSKMTNSLVQASTLLNNDLQALSSIDAASAQIIADAIAQLSPAQLKAIAEALHTAHAATYTNMPVSKVSNNASLPTQVLGASRDMLLGTPDAWKEEKDGLVSPLYRP